jgi:hypothetical protein
MFSSQKINSLEDGKARDSSKGKPKYDSLSSQGSGSIFQPLGSGNTGSPVTFSSGSQQPLSVLGNRAQNSTSNSSDFGSSRPNFSSGLPGSPKYRDLDLAPHVQPAAGSMLSLYVTQVPDMKSMGAKSEPKREETNGIGSILQRRPQTASAGTLGGLRSGMNSPKSKENRTSNGLYSRGEKERVSFYYFWFNFGKLKLGSRDMFEAGLMEHRDLFQQIFQGLHYMRSIRDTPISILEQKRVYLDRHPKSASSFI